jgi:hypothetical protein
VNFSCGRCGRHYTIADEKVQGRSFRSRCKVCESVIAVSADGRATTHPPPGGAAPALAPAPTLTPSPGFAPALTPAPRPSPPEVTRAPPALPPAIAARPHVPAPPAMAAPGPAAAMSDAELAWLAGGGGRSLEPMAPSGAGEPAPAASAPPPRRRHALLAGGAALGLAACAAGAYLALAGRKPVAPAVAPPVAAAPVAAPVAPTAPEPAPAEAPPTEAATATAAATPAAPPARRRTRADFEAPAMDAGGGDRRRNLAIASKDRKLLDLLDRKADAAPAPGIERTSLDTGRPVLDRAVVERAVADNRPAFAACVTKALKADPRLHVDDRRATLMLTVQPTGAVSGAWVAEAELERTSLGRCLVAASRRVVFPAFQGDAVDVAAPLALSAVR